MNEQKEVKDLIIPALLLQDILNYLAKQPFDQVQGFIAGVQSSAKPYEAGEAPLKEVK